MLLLGLIKYSQASRKSHQMVSCMVAYPLIHRLTGIETANGISATRQAPQFLVELHIDIFVLLHSDSPLTRIVFYFILLNVIFCRNGHMMHIHHGLMAPVTLYHGTLQSSLSEATRKEISR